MQQWLITAEQRHGGMTVDIQDFELWLDAEDEEEACEEGHRLLPRDWHAIAAEKGQTAQVSARPGKPQPRRFK